MIWENRWHPLLERWVTISSHRGARPWQGARVSETGKAPSYDPECYLCPNGRRISGARNPNYDQVFVFDNDHPAFGVDAPVTSPSQEPYLTSRAEGICRVMCYSPDHSERLSGLKALDMQRVIEVWRDQTQMLMAQDEIDQVFIFENNGEVVGVSNPHPHCQLYALPFVLPVTQQIISALASYRARQKVNLFDDIIAREIADGRRLLSESSDWIAFVPFFAQLPYETWIVAKQPIRDLTHASKVSQGQLGEMLTEVLGMQDRLWPTPQAYILSIHQAPKSLSAESDYRCYIQIQPMLRGAGLQKYLAGVETAGGHFLNDGAPEEKAAELRATRSA